MKKILVPVDFGEYTGKTCQYALQIARKFKSEIRLFHSYFDQIIVSDSSFPTGVDTDTMLNEQLLRDIEMRAKEDIKKLRTRLVQQLKKENIKGVKVDYTLEGGEPESEIIAVSEEYKPDVIIMGSRGEGRKGILMGSVSKKVMVRAKAPVMAIPKDYDYKEISNVMYMTDFHSYDFELIEKLFKLLKDFDIHVHCVHLNLHEDKREDNEKNMIKIKQKFNEKVKKGVLSCKLIDSSDINTDIENFVKENNIDIIAFLSQKRNLFQKLFKHEVSKKDLFQTNIPLLSFHTES